MGSEMCIRDRFTTTLGSVSIIPSTGHFITSCFSVLFVVNSLIRELFTDMETSPLPFINVISVTLKPIVERLAMKLHYLFLRLRSVAARIRTPNFRIRGECSNRLRYRLVFFFFL